jgi:hypothetical protein
MFLTVLLMISVGASALNVTAQQGASGDLSVVGEVSVNGRKVQTGDLISPESRVHTAKGSSAVVSLGKLGRVEVLPSTVLLITWDDSSISISISFGIVRVVALEGTTATVVTKEGVVVSDETQATTFTVDTECRNTFVSTQVGLARLRADNEVVEVPGGSTASAGREIGRCRHER